MCASRGGRDPRTLNSCLTLFFLSACFSCPSRGISGRASSGTECALLFRRAWMTWPSVMRRVSQLQPEPAAVVFRLTELPAAMLAARLPSCARGSTIWPLLTPERRRAFTRKCVATQNFGTVAPGCAYGRAFAAARDDPEGFWGDAASRLEWFQPWRRTVHVEDPVFPNWWVSREAT